MRTRRNRGDVAKLLGMLLSKLTMYVCYILLWGILCSSRIHWGVVRRFSLYTPGKHIN
jgi:hypothetical protein